MIRLFHRHTAPLYGTNGERILETVASRLESSIRPAGWFQRICQCGWERAHSSMLRCFHEHISESATPISESRVAEFHEVRRKRFG